MTDETYPNPRGPQPSTYDGDLGEPGYRARNSLVEELGEVADELRQVRVDFGANPYTVHAVRIRWSGGERGRGEPTVVADVPLLPTPELRSISAWERSLDSAGSVERGDSVLIGVSPRYTEDELSSYLATGADAEEAFIEVRIDQRDGTTKRRRFVLAAPPERRPTKFDWRIKLRKQDGDRLRNGSPRAAREKVWPTSG